MFSIGFLTLDVLIILVILVGFFMLALSKGEHVLAKIILSFYPATLIYFYLPYVSVSGAVPKIVTYVVVFLATHFLLSKHFTTKRAYTKSKKTFDGILLSIATLIIILTVYYHVIPLHVLYNFTLPFSYIFTTTIPFGAWLLVPIILLVISNKGHH